eukprot:8739062-Karenia_brevis.AAC.1
MPQRCWGRGAAVEVHAPKCRRGAVAEVPSRCRRRGAADVLLRVLPRCRHRCVAPRWRQGAGGE